jgi:hypothetical protein
MKRRPLLVAAAIAAIAVLGANLGGAATLQKRATVPALSSDTPLASRTYAMGFGMTPPVPTTEAILDIIPRIAAVSEYTILQREVPWSRFAAGQSIGQALDEEYDEMVEYLTEAQGLRLVILIDPLDGLDRTREGNEARRNGVTLLDPASRAIHEAFVLEVARRYQPDYLGLASEINTLAAHGDANLYVTIRDMINGLVPGLREVAPDTKLFVSYQVDDAWGLTGQPSAVEDQFALVHDFPEMDVIGLSSYPVFFWDRPEDIPDDYYDRFAEESGKPLIHVEGGWSSKRTAWMTPGREASPEVQARYFTKLFELLDRVEAELLVMLIFSDLDLSQPGWGLEPGQITSLENFASMGILDVNLQPKPAFTAWEAARSRRCSAPGCER